MRITRLVKRLGRTVTNRATFHSIKLEAEVEAVLNEADKVEDVEQALFDQAAKMLEEDYTRIKERKSDERKTSET